MTVVENPKVLVAELQSATTTWFAHRFFNRYDAFSIRPHGCNIATQQPDYDSVHFSYEFRDSSTVTRSLDVHEGMLFSSKSAYKYV